MKVCRGLLVLTLWGKLERELVESVLLAVALLFVINRGAEGSVAASFG